MFVRMSAVLTDRRLTNDWPTDLMVQWISLVGTNDSGWDYTRTDDLVHELYLNDPKTNLKVIEHCGLLDFSHMDIQIEVDFR